MKKIIMIMILFWWASSLYPLEAGAIKKKKTVVKIAVLIPKGAGGSNILEDFRQAVKKQTKEEVDFKIYWGGIQGDEKDVVRKIRFKQLHGSLFSGHGLGQIVPEVRVTELPYLFMNYEEVFYVRHKIENIMNQKFRDQGFIVLGWSTLGFVYPFLTKPIKRHEKLKKIKSWIWEDDPVAYEFNKVLGIVPVSLSVADVLGSVSSGLVDMVAAPPLAALAFRWQTKFKYMANVPAINSLGALIISKDVWKKISISNQKIILDIARKNLSNYINFIIKENEKALKVLKKGGVSILRVDDQENFMAGQKAAGKTRNNLIGKLYPKVLLEKVLAWLKEYRDKNPHPATAIIK